MRQLFIRDEDELKFRREATASAMTTEGMKAVSQKWQKSLKSGSFTDSKDLLREDRNR